MVDFPISSPMILYRPSIKYISQAKEVGYFGQMRTYKKEIYYTQLYLNLSKNKLKHVRKRGGRAKQDSFGYVRYGWPLTRTYRNVS